MNKLNINDLRAYCNNKLGISCRENGKLLDKQSLLRKIKLHQQNQRGGGADVHYWLADFSGPAMLPHEDDENDDGTLPFIDPVLDAEIVQILSNYDFPFGKITGVLDYEIFEEDEHKHPIGYSFAVETDPECEDGWLTFSISIDVNTGDLTVTGYIDGDVDAEHWPDALLQQLKVDFRTFIRS